MANTRNIDKTLVVLDLILRASEHTIGSLRDKHISVRETWGFFDLAKDVPEALSAAREIPEEALDLNQEELEQIQRHIGEHLAEHTEAPTTELVLAISEFILPTIRLIKLRSGHPQPFRIG